MIHVVTNKDFLSIADVSAPEILRLLQQATLLKKELREKGKNRPLLGGKTLIMIFEKPSLRTHASFEVGMTQLGGHAIYFGPEHIGLGKREPVSDAARVLSSYGDILMARVFKHETVRELAKHATVPVINGLSDREHPCQILADIMTIREKKGKIKGLKVAYVGDGENNVAHSLAMAAGLLGFHLTVACPKGYKMKPEVVSQVKGLVRKSAGSILETTDPKEAVKDADVVYTDTWVSMGDEAEKVARLKVFPPYQVTMDLMNLAKPDVIFMHDMPAYRGNEVAADFIDGPQSVIFDQAENRLHVQKGLMVYLMKQGGNI